MTPVLLTIGEFSKMTYLSVKALRHYHDVGLLEPAQIDPASGYRRYAADQVVAAQAIRRFRDLDMPLEQVRAVLEAPDTATRNRAIVQHLERMREQLARTQLTVASLQALLDETAAARPVTYRRLSATRVLAITETVAFEEADAWCTRVFDELHAVLDAEAAGAPGHDGALYSSEFFEAGAGPVTAFVPLAGAVSPTGAFTAIELPAVDVAVMVHDGPFGDLDQTYGALGTVVAERGVGADGPIREHYASDDRTEVCWPITTIPGGSP